MKWVLWCFIASQTIICDADDRRPSLPSDQPPFKMTDLCVVTAFTERDTSSVEIAFLWQSDAVTTTRDSKARSRSLWHGRRFKTESDALRVWTRDGVELSNEEFSARLVEPMRAVLLRKPFGKLHSAQQYAKFFSPETVFILAEQWIHSFRDAPLEPIKPPKLPGSSRAGTSR